jgi:hypothetical protein
MSRVAVAVVVAAAWLSNAPQARGQPALHAYHATKLSMDCKTCHVPVQQGSVTLRRPGHSECVTCHAMAFRRANNPKICQECHASSKPEGSAGLLPYPRFKGQRPLLTEFSHARHVDELGRLDVRTGFRADCSHCHKLAGEGKLAGLPQHVECAGCHGRPEIRPRLNAATTTGDCRACHSPEEIEKPSAQAASNLWPYIEFSHRVHLRSGQRETADCITCHRTVAVSASRATLSRPAMLECVGCHEAGRRLGAQFQLSNCGLCHRDGVEGALPASHNSNVRPVSHNQSFRVQHREQAAAADAKCFACHSSVSPNAVAGSQCVACHQVTRPVSHTARWKDDIHGRYAALDRVACATCHTADYCSRCHNELPRTHVPLALFKNGAHARPAKLDQRACLTCHTFESSCASCHRRN